MRPMYCIKTVVHIQIWITFPTIKPCCILRISPSTVRAWICWFQHSATTFRQLCGQPYHFIVPGLITGGGVRGQTVDRRGYWEQNLSHTIRLPLKPAYSLTFSRKWLPSVTFLSTSCETTLIHAVLCSCISRQGAQWQHTFRSLKVIIISSTSYVQIEQVLWFFQPFHVFWKFYL
jgi:hypothetical protein